MEWFDKTLLQSMVRKSTLPNAVELEKEIVEHRHVYAIMALLLAQCCNLESLTMDIGFLRDHNKWLPILLQRAVADTYGAAPISIFSNLSHVPFTISLDNQEEAAFSIKTILLFFRLQPLRTMEMTAMQKLSQSDLDGKDPAVQSLADVHAPSALHTLKLHRSMAPPRTLGALLQKSQHLRTLLHDYYMPSASIPLNFVILRQALGHVRSTLTELTVRHDDFHDAVENDNLTFSPLLCGSLGSFYAFTALTDLRISIGVLFGQEPRSELPSLASVLPSSLRRLTVYDELKKNLRHRRVAKL